MFLPINEAAAQLAAHIETYTHAFRSRHSHCDTAALEQMSLGTHTLTESNDTFQPTHDYSGNCA